MFLNQKLTLRYRPLAPQVAWGRSLFFFLDWRARFIDALPVFTGLVQIGPTFPAKPHARRISNAFLLLLLILGGWIVVPAQRPSKEIAVTIDDLPLNGPR